MTHYRYRDRLFEVEVLSVPGTELWMVEVWDLSPSGGELMHGRQAADGTVTLDFLGKPIDSDLALWAIEKAKEELRDYA
ncbi:hypothetical protein ADK53_36150 [Streptomyces sp. WM6373]|uniref:hypothetical protein n=1 Tax=Streptomyces TaxID=1883 RepID=UPI0006AF963D|nr:MULTISPECIES: hypothetical protein [unclassified Streptomyces]KOU27735.1 hypothetical protein ADK53_36150 [Streptomyces sp. WM6373]KOU84889.1 hypothetical protein ADK61_05985 [Streptomyces sp. XY66]KOU89888.1 hypothetical protein ADK93_10710 [Streptomyces sp. XY58]KOV12597.1 hypothetical protein ADK89_02485 [Streptomyces sp. XY37]KOV50246.1 hypothetical protein ADK99_10230 [Streptomyces sp. MMG1064]